MEDNLFTRPKVYTYTKSVDTRMEVNIYGA